MALPRRSILLVLLLGIARLPSAADSLDALALLEAHCVRCHGGEKTKGGLDLTTRERLLKGGETGSVVVTPNADSSLLVRSIRHETDSGMPYKEKKLSESAIETIAKWVRDSAPYDRILKATVSTAKVVSDERERHWAFEPVRRPKLPSGKFANPLDRFIATRLAEAGLELSAPAPRAPLIRRVTFDLIGLPPTIAEVDTFEKNASPRAYEELIDRLLASPLYGERWGRHWLDLARYAESDGFEHDATRPHSWRYRDYVINAFNADKPYDQFIREQLAGDELFPEDPVAITATAFNLLGPDMVDSSDQVQRRHNTLNDMTDTVASTFLGLTMGCARCHDHKFEPITQRDYYSFQAFFAPAKFNAEQSIPTRAERAAFDTAMKAYHEQPANRALAELEQPVRKTILARKVAQLSTEAQSAHNTPVDQRNAEQANLVLETQDKVNIVESDLAAAFKGAEKERRNQLVDEIKRLAKPPMLPKSMALAANPTVAARARVLNRGEYSQPGDEVSANIPVVLKSSARSPTSETQPRAALANWISSPANPLTARVMVNRIWQHHFGRPLVGSPSDLGAHGQKPSHPELLDWLASEFVNRGWSIKQMHKLMLMSQTYQQTSKSTSGAKKDPENKLYWRMNRLRLEGEAIRDSLLALSGELRTEIGGPSVYPPIPKELFQGAAGWPAVDRNSKHDRRSIYIFARRNLRFPFLEAFDLPDNNLSCPIRERSTTAPQSLSLLNSDEVMRAAKRTAARIENEAKDRDVRINLCYRTILNRAPNPQETEIARQFLAQSPTSELCRALFNLNDFVYVE